MDDDEVIQPATLTYQLPRKVCNLHNLELAEIRFALQELPTLKEAAKELGIAVRTLQRKIKKNKLKEISSGN